MYIEELDKLENEEWREHPIGIYGSNKGRCYVPKTSNSKAHYTYGSNSGNGYKRIKWKGKEYSVHRLVAELFIPNPNNYLEVDHINRNKYDNRVENLRWANRSMQQYNRDFSNHKNNAKSKQVMQIDIKTNEIIRIWESINECGRNEFKSSAVSRCCLGKQNFYKGFKWQYVA